MAIRILLRYSLPVFLVLVFLHPGASGQFGNTYYHMHLVPQANQLNPAFQPECNGYLGLVSPIRFNVESSSLTYGDIFAWNSSERKYMTFMHPSGDKDRFMDALQPVNVVRAEVVSSLLSFGWRKENLFFTMDFSERIIQEISFPEDFAEFLIYGNKNISDFNFSDLSENLTHFHQISLGASYNLEDEMQFGIRAKILLGGANATTRRSDVSMKTSIEEWDIKSDIKVDASIPFLESVPLDDEGFLDMDSIANILDLEDTTLFDILFGLPGEGSDLLTPGGLKTIGGIKNPGIAIDFGFSYTPIEKLTVSASVVDLGFIRWKNYVYNFEQNLDYTFDGIEFKLEEDYSPGEALLDSLKQDLRIRVTKDPYTTMMTGKVYLGAAYDLREWIRFGGVFRTRIHNYRFYNQFTVSANFRPISMFSASFSYSIMGGSYMNLGLGISLRLGPLNLYFITDQAPSAYFFPQEFSSLNFRMGLNIVWGCAAVPKAMKDRPLID